MERLSSSVQSWVEEHKLATIGGLGAAAVGASVAYARTHAKALLTLAVLGGGAALAHHYYYSTSKSREADLDYDFYSQLPSATDADGKENERVNSPGPATENQRMRGEIGGRSRCAPERERETETEKKFGGEVDRLCHSVMVQEFLSRSLLYPTHGPSLNH